MPADRWRFCLSLTIGAAMDQIKSDGPIFLNFFQAAAKHHESGTEKNHGLRLGKDAHRQGTGTDKVCFPPS